MNLSKKQAADYAKLKSYYPYRLFFLVQEAGATEAVVWALRDKRAANEALRRGGTVHQISRS